MTVTDKMVELALVEWRKIIRLQLVASIEDPDEIQTCRIIPRTEAPAMRAALEAALSGKENKDTVLVAPPDSDPGWHDVVDTIRPTGKNHPND